MSGTDDLGAPVSYLALEEGTAVLAADGDEVGQVAVVLADEENDIFDGIVISHGLGRHTFADAEQVGEIHERGVVLDAHRRRGGGAARAQREPRGDGGRPVRAGELADRRQAAPRLGPALGQLLSAPRA